MRLVHRDRRSAALLVLAPVWIAACASVGDELDVPSGVETVVQSVTIPAKGDATTLDIASWNIEWFGDTANGPTNEALQLQNARAVIAGADMDIWGVAEIVSLAQWNNLKAQLPGYAGFIAKEPNVVNGAAFYSDFNDTEQNVG